MVSKEYEEMFLIIVCLVGAFVVYKIFTMFWKGSTIEGLQNQTPPSGLAENSSSNLANFNKELEALENKVLLTTPQYNTNYSDKCSASYDAANYLMVQTMANLDMSNPALFIQQLETLNTLYQAKISLNDTLKFIDSTETTDSTDSTATNSASSAMNAIKSKF
jgi:hypothetical protein